MNKTRNTLGALAKAQSKIISLLRWLIVNRDKENQIYRLKSRKEKESPYEDDQDPKNDNNAYC